MQIAAHSINAPAAGLQPIRGAPFSGFCGLPSLISHQFLLKSIWSVSEELIKLYLRPTCKHLPSVIREEKRVSSLTDEGCVLWLTDIQYSWITDPYSIFDADRVWKTAGIREKLASEHFWWNNINKDRWVFIAKPDQRRVPVGWELSLTGCLFMFSVQNVHLSWGLLHHNLVVWTCSRVRATCSSSWLYLWMTSSNSLQSMFSACLCSHSVRVWKGRQQLSNVPESSSLILIWFVIILLNKKLLNLLPAGGFLGWRLHFHPMLRERATFSQACPAH